MRRIFAVLLSLATTACVVQRTDVEFPGLVKVQDIASSCRENTMTMQQDALGKPVLYVAAKEGGLKIYDISGPAQLLTSISTGELQKLHVMSLAQSGSLLFLALGDHFSGKQGTGLAVIDVDRPGSARVVDVWSDSSLKSGAGVVAVEGSDVFLGAMQGGVIAFSTSRAGKLRKQSQFLPDLSFPDPRPDARKYNARGMFVDKGLIFLAYDAGGLRVLDASNPTRMTEVGRYSNPVLNGKPRAYNNLIVDGSLAYVAVDYCGLEILDVSDPRAIRQVSWWNPEQCQTSPWKWFKSSIHTNEIAHDRQCNTVFLSSGKSDLQVVSVADPTRPVLRGEYGGVSNGIGTWGVSKHGENVFLSYICTLGIPFPSNWSGIRMLRYDDACY